MAWLNGTLYAVKRNIDGWANISSPSVFAVGGSTSAPPPTASPAPEPASIPGGEDASMRHLHSLVFENATSLWMTSYAADSPTENFSLYNFLFDTGFARWIIAPGYPKGAITFDFDGKQTAVSNARGVAGYVDPASSHFTLAYSTGSAEGVDWLVTYDTATGAARGLARAPAYTMWLGVALAPVQPAAVV